MVVVEEELSPSLAGTCKYICTNVMIINNTFLSSSIYIESRFLHATHNFFRTVALVISSLTYFSFTPLTIYNTVITATTKPLYDALTATDPFYPSKI